MVVKVNSPHKAMRESRARVARRVRTAGARARKRRRRLGHLLEQVRDGGAAAELARVVHGHVGLLRASATRRKQIKALLQSKGAG